VSELELVRPRAAHRRCRPAGSATWPQPPPCRSTTVRGTAGLPATRRRRAGPAHAGLGLGGVPHMRVNVTVNGEKRQVDDVWEGESLPLRPARTDGPARQQERLRARRMRLVHGVPGRRDGVARASLPPARPRAARWSPSRDWAAPRSSTRYSRRSWTPGPCSGGFCTPGLIVATHELLARDPHPSTVDVREALAGNLCRCTGYEAIIDAVHLAAERILVVITIDAAYVANGVRRRVRVRTPSDRRQPDRVGRRPVQGRTVARGSMAVAAWSHPGWSTPTTTCTSG